MKFSSSTTVLFFAATAAMTAMTMVPTVSAASNGLKRSSSTNHHLRDELVEIPTAGAGANEHGRNLLRKAKKGKKRGGLKLFKKAKEVSSDSADIDNEDVLDNKDIDYDNNNDNIKRILAETKLSVDGVSVTEEDPMTGAEILFMEDAFKAAYNELIGNGNDDDGWEAHSVLMDSNESGRRFLRDDMDEDNNSSNNADRQLAYDHTFFDAYIYSDFRCHLCGGDDDDDDDTVWVTHPPSQAPSQAPTVDVEEKLSSVNIENVFCSYLRTSRYRRFRSASNCSFKTTSFN